MTKIELPPLPDGEGWVVRHANGDESITGWPAQQDEKLQPVFTADQLRARDRQIVELCAQIVKEAGPKEGSLKLVTDGFVAAILTLLGDQHG